MFRHPAWAVGSYSSGPATAGTVGTKSTGGCYRGDVLPCTVGYQILLLCLSGRAAESAEELPGEPVLRQRLRVDVLADEAVGERGEALEGAAVGHGRVLVPEEGAQALHARGQALVRRLHLGAQSNEGSWRFRIEPVNFRQ